MQKFNKLFKTAFLGLLIVLPLPSHAVLFTDLINIAVQIQAYQFQMLDIQGSIQRLNGQIQEAISGQSEWGSWQYTDYSSWGKNTAHWNEVLTLAEKGGNNSQLGRTLRLLAQEFPFDTALYNQTNPNKADQIYYSLKAKTALAARAASQLSYDKIQEQIHYTHQLRQQIGKTTTLKQSLDLQNRLTIENSFIQLETLRQLALINQQHAIDSQAEINNSIQNARFLNQKF
jgi:Type IV secretion system proteins